MNPPSMLQLFPTTEREVLTSRPPVRPLTWSSSAVWRKPDSSWRRTCTSPRYINCSSWRNSWCATSFKITMGCSHGFICEQSYIIYHCSAGFSRTEIKLRHSWKKLNMWSLDMSSSVQNWKFVFHDFSQVIDKFNEAKKANVLKPTEDLDMLSYQQTSY